MAQFSYAFSPAFDALVFDTILPLSLTVSPTAVKEGDTHGITLTIKDSSGAAVDLISATVRLLARSATTGTVTTLAGTLGVVAGTITHLLTGTLTAGGYQLEAEVTISDVITTAPTNGYTALRVVSDLD